MSNASSGFAVAAAVIVAVVTAPLPGFAQQPPRPAQPQPPQQGPQSQRPQAPRPMPLKPYTPIAVTLPKPHADPSFEAFRKQLGEIVSRKDRAALARLVANDFFWMGEHGDKANKKKSGIDNLAAAVGLDAKNGPGWELLGEAASEATLEAIPEHKGIMCAPATPTFDEKALEQLGKATGTGPGDWGYPEKAGVEVHGAPQPGAPVIDRLGMYLIRVLPEPPANGAQQPPAFVRVFTPSGKTGYVANEAISPLANDQLCYRNEAGTWKIAGYAE